MDARPDIATGPPWEPVVGDSRVVPGAPHALLPGTTATDAAGRVAEREAGGSVGGGP